MAARHKIYIIGALVFKLFENLGEALYGYLSSLTSRQREILTINAL